MMLLLAHQSKIRKTCDDNANSMTGSLAQARAMAQPAPPPPCLYSTLENLSIRNLFRWGSLNVGIQGYAIYALE